jgi:hypothetical protein
MCLTSGIQDDLLKPSHWNQAQIVVEVETFVDPSYWQSAKKYDDLQIVDDGYAVWLEGLRQRVGQLTCTWKVSQDDDGDYGGQYMTPRNIRINIAMEADWAITGRAGGDPEAASRRVEQHPHFQYHSPAKAMDYIEWLRRSSYLKGAVNGSAETDKCAAGSELFSDITGSGMSDRTLGKHAYARLRDVKRVIYTGELTLEGFNVGLRPGMGIILLGNGSYPVFSVLSCVAYSASQQTTTITLAGCDRERIYDHPTSAPTDYELGYGGGDSGRQEEPGYPYDRDPSGPGKDYLSEYGGTNESGYLKRSAPDMRKSSKWQKARSVYDDAGGNGASGGHQWAKEGTPLKVVPRDEPWMRTIKTGAEMDEQQNFPTIRTGDEMGSQKDYMKRASRGGRGAGGSPASRVARNRGADVPRAEDVGEEEADSSYK